MMDDIWYVTAVQCPLLDNLTDPNLRVAILSRVVGGQAMFSCIQGYGLHGPVHATCLQNATWTKPFPTCSGDYERIPTEIIFLKKFRLLSFCRLTHSHGAVR